MSKFCAITGKRPLVGNNVSKSNVKTKRRQLPNLQLKKIYIPELDKTVKIKLSVSAIKTIDKTVKLVNKHFDGSISTHKYFLFVYYAMVAEEKKTNSKLGKRIKLLGIYQILNENFSSQTAANFSRGLKWTVIDEECKRRGF